MASKIDFDIWIGNNPTIKFQFKDKLTGLEQDLSGFVFVMRALANGIEIYREQVSPVGGLVSFPWTTAQTRTVPVGAVTQYEVEARQVGSENTWLYGLITGRGGINDDIA